MTLVNSDLVVAAKLADPSAPVITNGGTPGLVTYTYKVVALDAAGGLTAASTAGSTTTGATTLGATDFNTLTWSAVTGAASYKVYRTVGGATQGLIASTALLTIDDTGLAGDGATASASNVTGTGTALRLGGVSTASLFTSGTFVGTIVLELSPDNVTWAPLATLTAPAITALPFTIWARARMSAYTSGTPKVTLVGQI